MKRLLLIPALAAAAFISTGCETTSAAGGLAAIAPIARTVSRGCDIGENWLGFSQKGVKAIGDVAEKIANATSPTNTVAAVTPAAQPTVQIVPAAQ